MATAVQIPSDVQDAGPDAVKRYRKCIRNGESPRFAEMLALRAAPRAKTDETYLAQLNRERRGTTLADQFRGNEPMLEHRIAQAKRQGYTPKATDFYDSSLARFPGDKRAFLNNTNGISGLKRQMRESGEGFIQSHDLTVPQNTDIAPRPPKKLAEDIVDRIETRMVQEDPGLATKDRRELRSMIKDKHGSNEKGAVE